MTSAIGTKWDTFTGATTRSTAARMTPGCRMSAMLRIQQVLAAELVPPVPRLRNPQIAAWLEIVLANKPGNGRTIAFPIEYDELAVTAYLARNRDPDVAIIGVVSEQRVKRLARRNAQRMKERPVKTDPTELVHEDERLRQRLVTRINLERHAYDLRFYYEYTTEGAICITYQLRNATESSVIGERLIPGTGTPDGRGTANSREEAV
jgi:hypothetical protein